MAGLEKVDTSLLYDERENSIIDHSLGILNKIIARYDDPEMLRGLSIDKMDSVLRLVDSSMNTVNKLSSAKLKLMNIKSDSDDRTRMMSILTNINLRREINQARSSDNYTELRDDDIIDVDTTVVRGELSTGVEQLTLELLDLEDEVSKED